MKEWTKTESKLLKSIYPSHPDAELAKLFQTTPEDLQAHATYLALSKNKALFKGQRMPRWTQEETTYLLEQYHLQPSVSIARRLGRSHASVVSKANSLKLKKYPRQEETS